jgi:predicted oxidoreductase
VTSLVPPLQKIVEPKALTKAQKLSKALEQCKKEPKRKRVGCEKQAHQKYALVAERSKRT